MRLHLSATSSLLIVLFCFQYPVKAQQFSETYSRPNFLPCNNWLLLPSQGSKVQIGDADITGTQITVEASFNRTQPLNSGLYYGSLVSKHTNQADANYSLLPNGCEITTTNGYTAIFQACPLNLNETYHVAMVYNGTTLKYYRDGFLLSQTPWTGSLITNNLSATIGQIAGGTDPSINQFLGYINEVRIWNVARTQSDIRTYMDAPIPSPATQAGLIAYYQFDSWANKQGNSSYNGTGFSLAALNNVNNNCSFTPDSCATEQIINQYTPVLAYGSCKNILTVEDGTAFQTGDTVLLIQMKGAEIDITNSASFGTISNYRNAGNYEFNYVKSRTGNLIELLNVIERQYDIPNGKVQLIRVPYYQNYSTTRNLTCLPWDGSKGGVLAFNVQNQFSLNHSIDVTGRGFKGGVGQNTSLLVTNCFTNGYNYPSTSVVAAAKGESIAEISTSINRGKGSPAGGGGGGLDHNSGGGGGGNGGMGGFGGYQLEPCGNAPFDNRGLGGKNLIYNNTVNKIFLGSGGGAGHANNPANANQILSGGNGGGIVIISAQSMVVSNSARIISKGGDGVGCVGTIDCHDAMGGGGAGGTVLLNIPQVINAVSVEIHGGKGADMTGPVPTAGRIGSGGGGGGGVYWTSTPSIQTNLSVISSGGPNGVLTTDNNNAWGATPGQTGINLFGLVLPIDDVLFKPNIDSVRIRQTPTSCNSYSFEGFGFTNTNPVASWQWFFGDGNTANTQNANHTYSTPGAYTVKLIVTDINGCKDSIESNILPSSLNFDFGYEVNVCNPLTVVFTGNGNSTTDPYWNYGDGNNSTGNINPTHTYSTPGTYIVKYSVSNGVCRDTVTKSITVGLLLENIILTPDTVICAGNTKQLRTVPSLSFCWTPTTYLDDPNSPSPVTSTPVPITYYFTAQTTGTNLITNGDFSQGNTGFTSAYTYTSNNTTEAQYFVGNNPQAWNGSLSPCTDHSGTGNMMLVNGAPVAGVNVWRQSVPVSPNTNYAFSTWIQAVYPVNPAQLQFSINGIELGDPITATLPCNWTLFYTTWNSGISTNAIISIVNKNTQVAGNDFALDDISFAPVFIKRDSVKISIDSPNIQTTPDTLICKDQPVQLITTGAQTYSWSPSTGLSNASVSNPIATTSATVKYYVTGITAAGCTGRDSVTISLHPVPLITTSADTTICGNASVQIWANGGTGYSWSPASTLNNSGISNPVASPGTTTQYYVNVTDINSCVYRDSVLVSVRPLPLFSINGPLDVCDKDSVRLTASGGDSYNWQPVSGLSDATSANPMASPVANTTYTVTITESVCNSSQTLSADISVLPLPVIRATKSNDIDCSNDQSILGATGGTSYNWTPVQTLNNPTIPNPVASPLTNTTYYVLGTDADGCSNIDSVLVKVENINKGVYMMATGFTPNNDGLNDCFGIKYWGVIEELEFSIYNRWGERVFYTTDRSRCWDGTYKGVKQDANVYVYMIRAKTTCENLVFRKGTFVLIR